VVRARSEQRRRDLGAALVDLLVDGFEPVVAVHELARLGGSGGFGPELQRLAAQLEQGGTLGDSPLVPAELTAILAAELPTTERQQALEALSRHLRRQYQLARSPLWALLYPLLLALALSGYASFMHTRFTTPLPYSGMLGSWALRGPLLIALALWTYWLWWRRRERSPSSALSRLIELSVSGIRPLRRSLEAPATAMAARCLALSLRAKLSLVAALGLAAPATKSARVARALTDLRTRTAAGEPIDAAAASARGLPSAIRGALIHADPRDLPRALELIADDAERRAALANTRLTRLVFGACLLIVAGGAALMLTESWSHLVTVAGGVG
jgi:type II secretory pathway component PulF